MYQQAGAVAAAAPAAAAPAAQVVASYGTATGPSSTGTGAVVYQQPSAGASYAAYSAPADAAAGGAAAVGAAPAAGTWMGAVQQLASSGTAAPAGSASVTYATAAAPVATYQQQQVVRFGISSTASVECLSCWCCMILSRGSFSVMGMGGLLQV